LPKVISEKVGDALLGVAANRQVCPTFSEITFGNHSNNYLIEAEGQNITNYSMVCPARFCLTRDR